MFMDEVLSLCRNKSDAIEIAQDCENFLAIPIIVKRTLIDRLMFRWRVVADSQHLSDGFLWEMDA